MGITVIMSKTENSIQKVDELTKLSYICRHYVLSSPTYLEIRNSDLMLKSQPSS